MINAPLRSAIADRMATHDLVAVFAPSQKPPMPHIRVKDHPPEFHRQVALPGQVVLCRSDQNTENLRHAAEWVLVKVNLREHHDLFIQDASAGCTPL